MLQDINEISDGKTYGAQDMARVGCSDCAGCHSCCEQMGDTIFLDPYDVFRLTTALGQTFEELLNGALELHVETGVIVPNLKMREADSQCYFLNEQGRCTIHAHRPGLCRVFPLGRIYEEDGISYFSAERWLQKRQPDESKSQQMAGYTGTETLSSFPCGLARRKKTDRGNGHGRRGCKTN